MTWNIYIYKVVKLNQAHVWSADYTIECPAVGWMDTLTRKDLQCLVRIDPKENISSTAFQNEKVYKFLLQ